MAYQDRFKSRANSSKKQLELFTTALTYVRKTIFMWPLFPAGLLWFYLLLIGRSDLFLPSLSNPAGLTAFLIGFLLTGLLLIIGFTGPSVGMSVIQHALSKDLGDEASGVVKKTFGVTLFGVFLGFAIAARFSLDAFPVGVFLAIGGYFAHLYVNERLVFEAMTGGAGKSRWKRAFSLIFQVTFLVIGATSLLLPSLFLYSLFGFKSDAWWANIVSLIIVTVFMLMISIPAFFYSIDKARGTSERKALVTYLFAVFVMIYVLVFILIPTLPGRVLESTAQTIGIRDMEVRKYRIRTDRLTIDDFGTHTWSKEGTGVADKGTFKVEAIAPFSIGSILLLCPKSLADRDSLKASSMQMCVVLKQEEATLIPVAKDEPKDAQTESLSE